MEELILRFGHITKQIFSNLDDKSLSDCREVSKSWRNFLDGQKFLHIRIIQSHIEKKHEIGEPWKKLLKISNSEMIILLNSAVKEVYSKNICWTTKQMFDPLHVAAIYGQKCLYKYIEEKVGDWTLTIFV